MQYSLTQQPLQLSEAQVPKASKLPKALKAVSNAQGTGATLPCALLSWLQLLFQERICVFLMQIKIHFFYVKEI